MRKSRFSASQREAIVSSHLKGSKTVEQLCEAHQISPATFYKWKNELETDKNEDKKRLKELESENPRLKKCMLNYSSNMKWYRRRLRY